MDGYKSLLTKSVFGAALALCAAGAPAMAETIVIDAQENVGWYSAPRQMQILDDRPLVREFRQAPQRPQTVEISSNYGSGSGAGSVDRTTCGTIPRGGLHLSGNDAGSSPQASGALPRSSSDHGVCAPAADQPMMLPTAASANRLLMKPEVRQRGSLLRSNH
jgi:hypothetical protein